MTSGGSTRVRAGHNDPAPVVSCWEASGEAPRPTSGRRAVRAPDGVGGGTNHHPHQWLRRREIRASASVGGDRGPQVGPALAAEITTVLPIGLTPNAPMGSVAAWAG